MLLCLFPGLAPWAFLLDPFGVPGVFAPEIRLDSLGWTRQKAAASLQLVGGIDTMHDNSPRTTLSEGSRGITEEISASFCPSNPSQTLAALLLNSQFALNLLQRNPLGFRQKVRNHDQLEDHHQGKEREGVAA